MDIIAYALITIIGVSIVYGFIRLMLLISNKQKPNQKKNGNRQLTEYVKTGKSSMNAIYHPPDSIPFRTLPKDTISYPPLGHNRSFNKKTVNGIEVPQSDRYNQDDVVRVVGIFSDCGYIVRIDFDENVMYYNKDGEAPSTIALDKIRNYSTACPTDVQKIISNEYTPEYA